MEDYEERHSRVALVLLLLGAVLIAVSVVMLWVVRGPKPPPAGDQAATQVRVGAAVFLRWLGWIAAIVLIFVVGTLVMLRFSRRFRARMLQQRSPATPVDDVWGMARLPAEPMGDIPSPAIDPRPRPRRRKKKP